MSFHNNGTIAVMYHYVRDNKLENTLNLQSLSIVNFKKQLDWLEGNFKPMSFNEYNKCIKENTPFPDNKFLLTFDDGLKDHYDHVYPELKKRNLWGMFYINSQVFLEKNPLAVHITHFILDKIGVEKYTQLIQSKLEKYNIKLEVSYFDEIYRYDDASYKAVKKIMNYELDYKIRDVIIDELFYDFFNSKEQFCNDVYCNENEIEEMIKGGMVIGGHTHSHRVLSRLSSKEQFVELQRSADYLKNRYSINEPIFSFPYGHIDTYNNKTLEHLHELNYHSAFNTVRGATCIIKSGKYELQRYDTVDLYPH